MPLALVIAYPLLVHAAVISGWPALETMALCSLYGALFYSALQRRRGAAWLGLLGVAALSGGLSAIGGGAYALYLPALLIPAMSAAMFGLSLRGGATPVISHYARLSRSGELPAQIAHYTRRVTWAWTLLLSLITLVTLTLALSGERALWSWFSNVVSYLMLGALMAGEFIYRRWRFPEEPRNSFIDHLRLIARHPPRPHG